MPIESKSLPLCVTISDAMQLLGYKNRKGIEKLIRVGKLKAIQPTGRKILITYKSLTDLVEA